MPYTDLIREEEAKVVKQISSFAEANNYLTRFYKNIPARYSLDGLEELMDFLDRPQEKFKAVHIAGTSGKTSTAYYLSAMLASTGRKVGLTVSPHVDEINERVQINGRPLPEKAFCKALTEFMEIMEKSLAKPSWYEAVIAFAYWYFAREKVDYAVIEVGLGGLKDGSNVIKRADKVCVITDIGLDHTHILGKTLAEIAQQKIGIVHEGNTVFSYRQSSEIIAVFKHWCDAQKANLIIIGGGQGGNDLPYYHRRNWRLAHSVYEHLQGRDNLTMLSPDDLNQAQHIAIPGRMDVLQIGGKTVIMDGAHNFQKMTAFLKSLKELYPKAKPAVLLSLREGKEYEELAPLLASAAGSLIITTFQADQDEPAKSIDPKTLAQAFAKADKPAKVIIDQKAAFKALLATPEPVCLVTGSFYLLGQIRNNENLA